MCAILYAFSYLNERLRDCAPMQAYQRSVLKERTKGAYPLERSPRKDNPNPLERTPRKDNPNPLERTTSPDSYTRTL